MFFSRYEQKSKKKETEAHLETADPTSVQDPFLRERLLEKSFSRSAVSFAQSLWMETSFAQLLWMETSFVQLLWMGTPFAQPLLMEISLGLLLSLRALSTSQQV